MTDQGEDSTDRKTNNPNPNLMTVGEYSWLVKNEHDAKKRADFISERFGRDPATVPKFNIDDKVYYHILETGSVLAGEILNNEMHPWYSMRIAMYCGGGIMFNCYEERLMLRNGVGFRLNLKWNDLTNGKLRNSSNNSSNNTSK